MSKQGLLIACEGIDGSGKSLLARNLFKLLCDNGIKTLLTKEPGGTALGQALRNILQSSQTPISSMSEFLLFAADRAQHFEKVVLPALASGTVVISDRMADSSLAYQGYGRGLDKEMIRSINSWVMQNKKPDIVFYITIDLATAQQRIMIRNEALTSFEQEKKDFWHRVQQGFETIFASDEHVHRLDGTQNPERLATTAALAVQALFNTKT